MLRPLVEDTDLILLAPKSARETWDRVYGGFDHDVRMIDEVLAEVFGRFTIDPERVFVAGFSDGASYALTLGLANGDLFGAVVAFSPGFAAPARRRGKPRVFVSHGMDDHVLPIARTSRPIVASLRDDGYDVSFREFPGSHTVPAAIASEAVDWLSQ